MRLVAVLALLALLPTAAAQVPVPEVPDPGDAEDAAIGTVCSLGLELPVCPATPVRLPGDPAEAHDHGGVTQADPVVTAQQGIEDIAEDPATAPDRVGDIAASIVQFLKDLLGLPVDAAQAAVDALAAVGAGTVGAVADAAGAVAAGAASSASAAGAGLAAVGDALADAAKAVRSLFAADSVDAGDAAGAAPSGTKGGSRDACVAGLCVDKTASDVADGALQKVD